MARTVLSARQNLRATCRADALSHACPTISSKRLLNGALLGNCSTRSVLIPHSGHRIRYNSITTVVRNSKHARSRISRSYTSWISLTRCPHLEHISFRFPAFRRTHSFSALARSSISCWYTRYPAHPRIFVHSLFLKLSSVAQNTPGFKTPSIAYSVTFLLRAGDMKNLILKLQVLKDTRGQDLIEYALMAGFVAVAAGAIMPGIATSISTIFSKVASVMNQASTQGS